MELGMNIMPLDATGHPHLCNFQFLTLTAILTSEMGATLATFKKGLQFCAVIDLRKTR